MTMRGNNTDTSSKIIRIVVVLILFSVTATLSAKYISRQKSFRNCTLALPQKASQNQITFAKYVEQHGIKLRQENISELKLYNDKSNQVASGNFMVSSIIQSHASSQAKLKDGILMCLALLLVYAVTTSSPSFSFFLTSISPFTVIISTLAIGVPCIHCSAGLQPWINATIGAGNIFYALLLSLILWNPKPLNSKTTYTLIIFCLGVLVTQGALLVDTPKFCLWCFLIGASTISILIHISNIRKSNNWLYFKASRNIKAVKSILLAGTVLTSISTASGMWKQAPAAPEPMANIEINQSIASLLDHYSPTKLSTKLVVVTLPGCHACSIAKDVLKSNNIGFVELGPCSYLPFENEMCFKSNGKSYAAPTFIILDNRKMILASISGWDSNKTLDFIRTNLAKLGEKSNEDTN